MPRITKYLYHKLVKKDLELYGEIVEHSKSPIEEIRKNQLARLNHLLAYCNRNINYYKTRNYPTKINDLEAISNIPLLTKENIREDRESLINSKHAEKGSFLNTSGGSTGRPIEVVQDQLYAKESRANYLMVKEWRTKDPHAFTVILWGAARDLFGSNNTFKNKFRDWLINTKMFNSAKLEPADIKEFIDYINYKKPAMILAYAQSIYEVACAAEKHGWEVKKMNAIHSGAGQLFPFMRDKIESIFRTKVFDHYGGREFGALASECEAHEGLHILAYNRIVEVLDEEGNTCAPGEEGNLAVTVLDNYSMPLIRYLNGDRAIMQSYQPCKCGVTLPKLSKISGRTSNNFKKTNGGFVSGEFLTLTFNHIPGVLNFQIVQESILEIQIYLVVNEMYETTAIEERLKKKFSTLFGKECNVKFTYVDDIPKNKTGKHLYTISKI